MADAFDWHHLGTLFVSVGLAVAGALGLLGLLTESQFGVILSVLAALTLILLAKTLRERQDT